MWRVQRTHNPCNAIKRGTSAFLFLILFLLSLFVNKADAGWLRTEGEEFAEKFIYMIQKGDLAEVNKHLEPGLLSEDNQKAVKDALDVFPKGTIRKITRLQLNVNYGTGNKGRTDELQFYILMDTTALIMDEVLQKQGDRYVVHGFHFNEAPMNLMRQFPFNTIRWVQPKNVFMAGGVFNIILMTVALVLWFIRPIKMKLLWLPVIFAGVMETSAQWVDDGPWAFNFLAVKVPPVWIDTAAGQDPWSIVISLPLGAAVVLFLALTAEPELEELTFPTRPQTGMPPLNRPRQPVRPQARNRPQPTKVGK